MKQGDTKRKLPKDKHTKKSWQTRNEGRKAKQETYAFTHPTGGALYVDEMDPTPSENV